MTTSSATDADGLDVTASLQHALQRCRTAEAEVARLSALLDLARDLGRIGVWERDVRTLQGHWDEQVCAFWGLDPAQRTPDFQTAISTIVDPDPAVVAQKFRGSLEQAGRYGIRFTLRASDGSLHHLHSRWEVKDGAEGHPERVLGLMVDETEPLALVQAATEARSQLELAQEMCNIVTWRVDLGQQRVHYNAQGWQLLGETERPEGIAADEAMAAVHPEDRAKVLAAVGAALAGTRPVDQEARFRRHDGAWRTALTRRTVQRDASGKPVAMLGVALDLTERLAKERDAAEMQRRFELLSRTAGIGHWLLDHGGRRARWSDELRTLFGLAPDVPAPTRREFIERRVHEGDRARVSRQLATWLSGDGTESELFFRILRSDGEVREVFTHTHVEPGDSGPVLFGVVIDLTERHRSALALRSAEERVALAARGAGLGTFEFVHGQGEPIWDDQMWALRGRAPQPYGASAHERKAAVHPDDHPRITTAMKQARASGAPTDYEFRVVWPDGQVRWLASRSVELRDAGSNARRRIGVNWDVTDRHAADTARHERELAVRESEAKSRFLSRMSHELRTPLNAVLGFSQLLLAQADGTVPATPMQRQHVEHIHSAGQHLLALINDVLDLSRLEGGEMQLDLQPVALASVVAQAQALLGPLPQARGVTLHTQGATGQVMADPTRLRQALLNLLSNAVKYNHTGGSVHVEASVQNEHTMVRVRDSGRGMDAAQLAQLFEPFNRLGAERDGTEGTGIGLAITRSLVSHMGGTLRVRSEPGLGSEFEMELLSAPDQAQRSAPPNVGPAPVPGVADAPSAVPRQRGALLYIEDNPVNALIMRELLARRSGVALHVASDGVSGVAQAAQLGPALILLDMHLPDMDGFEVLRRLRAQPETAHIPCVAVSASAMPDYVARALAAGMQAYWTKPLDFKVANALLDQTFGPAR